MATAVAAARFQFTRVGFHFHARKGLVSLSVSFSLSLSLSLSLVRNAAMDAILIEALAVIKYRKKRLRPCRAAAPLKAEGLDESQP